MAAQVGHASNISNKLSLKKRLVEKAWLARGQPKIVLAARDTAHLKELKAEAEKAGLSTNLISDAGLTQVPAGTVTCLSIGPDLNSKIDKITGHLKLVDKWPHKFKET